MSSSLVSIIMPIYNSISYMTESINSVLNQTYNDIELILVDDGSTDDSWQQCLIFTSNDKRVRAFHIENRGPGNARNYGLNNANGNYICFIDSDDILRKDAISILVKTITKNNCDIVQCRSQKVYEDGCIDSEDWPEEVKILNVKEAMKSYLYDSKPVIRFSVWAKLYKASLLRSIRFPNMTNSEDVVFNLYAIASSSKLVYIPDSLYRVNIRYGSVSRKQLTAQMVLDSIACNDYITHYVKQHPEFTQYSSRVYWSKLLTLIRLRYEIGNSNIDDKKVIKETLYKSVNSIDKSGFTFSKKIIYLCFSRFPGITAVVLHRVINC